VAAGLALGSALYAGAAQRLPRPLLPARRQRPLLAAAIVSATVEELLWRGVLLGALRPRGTRRALAVTSAGFALSHLPRAGGRALAVYGALGSVLGLVAPRRRGLTVASVAHVTYDVLALLEEPP